MVFLLTMKSNFNIFSFSRQIYDQWVNAVLLSYRTLNSDDFYFFMLSHKPALDMIRALDMIQELDTIRSLDMIQALDMIRALDTIWPPAFPINGNEDSILDQIYGKQIFLAFYSEDLKF